MTTVYDPAELSEPCPPPHNGCRGIRTEFRTSEVIPQVGPLTVSLTLRIFLQESFDAPARPQAWDHTIELELGAKDFLTKVYPLSPNEQTESDASLRRI